MATYEYVKGQTNLSLAGSYSPAGPPALAGDTLRFSEGTGTINQGMNALAAIDFVEVSTRPAFSADVGEPGSPMEFDCDRTATGVFTYSGKGSVFYGKGGSGGTWNKVVWQPFNGRTTLFAQNVTITTLHCFGGFVKLPASVVLVDIIVGTAGRVLAEEHASDTIAAVTVRTGGVLEARRRIAGSTTVEQGATLIYDVDTTTASGTITLNGGTLIHKKGALVVVGSSGVYDYSKLEKTYLVTLTDGPGLTEVVGPVLPTFTRTTQGVGSQKVQG